MRLILLLVFLCVCMNSFGEVYKVHDKEQECDLYMAPTSIFMENYEEAELKKVSSMPALSFRKHNGEYSLKGLWSFVSLVNDVVVDREDIGLVMDYSFHSVCLSADKEIIHLEKSRMLLNNFNDLDANQ